MKRVLVVCLGNICRSPIGEGLLQHHAELHGIELHVDSAGTSGYHHGESPDQRSQDVMHEHGLSISQQRSRTLVPEDFKEHDMILVMDRQNFRDAQALADTVKHTCHIALFCQGVDVPDPYYGGEFGFESVYQMLDQASSAWVGEWAH